MTPTEHTSEYPLQWLKGVGPRRAEILAESGIVNETDLAMYFPYRHIDARDVIRLSDAKDYLWRSVTVRGTVAKVNHHSYPKPGRTSILLHDASGGYMYLMYFAYAEWIAKQYAPGDEVVAVGYVNIYRGDPQIVHPTAVEKISDEKRLIEGRILPLYRISEKMKEAHITQHQLRAMTEQLLAMRSLHSALPEFFPESLLRKHHFPKRIDAVRSVHYPDSPEVLSASLHRLRYEELFFLELRIAIERMKRNALARKGIRFDTRSLTTETNPDSVIARLLHSLPYQLTAAQKRVLAEIAADMQKSDKHLLPMNRLVQGDVGSGKTIVALLAMLIAAENGYQSVLMAPTEVLARQHFQSITSLLHGLPIEVTLVVGAQKKKQRAEILTDIAEGRTHITIGTHALLEENVRFSALGLVVADEQHKFGVEQRKILIEKNPDNPPDVLVMSATPIPRTLSMTLYRDLDVSTIDELPAGRKRITTRIVFPSRQRSLLRNIRDVVARGEQVYIVYPQLEKSETKDVKTAIASYETFRDKIFPDLRIGLVHGKLKPDEKQSVMSAFRAHQIDILVATSVIEVGIDVPNATLMVIGNAERFGLAQLHQLRGRVGRGGKQSECVLIPSAKLEPDPENALRSDEIEERRSALERLNVLASTDNGFEIAKADLAMRGPGSLLGTEQSGVLKLKLADIVRDEKLLESASADVEHILGIDPQLRDPIHKNIRAELLRHLSEEESFLAVG